MMTVPISFEYKGKLFTGSFESVPGHGVPEMEMWFLKSEGYYCGMFHYSHHHKEWRFDNNTNEMKELTDFFEFYMISWFQ